MRHWIEEALVMLDRAIDNKKKKHLATGILFSMSMIFGGLALTTMTMKL